MTTIEFMVAQMQNLQNSCLKGKALRAEIIKLSHNGSSQRTIAHRLGTSRTHVFNVLRGARES